jgi:GntR family transcriptional regulator/MocR family aminotransferase
MPLDRRLALIDWAHEADAWIIEDDYDCEFRYVGRPLAALQAIDRYGRVIYVGTFSKVIFPGLRLGYVICPEELVDAFVAAHASTDVHAHLLDQAVLSDFMQSTHFTPHLRRMRILYGTRQKTLIHEAQRLKGMLRVQPSDGGLHIVGWLPEHLSDTEVANLGVHHNLHLWPLSLHCIEASLQPAVLLGYAGTKERDIREGFLTFQTVMRTILGEQPDPIMDRSSTSS